MDHDSNHGSRFKSGITTQIMDHDSNHGYHCMGYPNFLTASGIIAAPNIFEQNLERINNHNHLKLA